MVLLHEALGRVADHHGLQSCTAAGCRPSQGASAAGRQSVGRAAAATVSAGLQASRGDSAELGSTPAAPAACNALRCTNPSGCQSGGSASQRRWAIQQQWLLHAAMVCTGGRGWHLLIKCPIERSPRQRYMLVQCVKAVVCRSPCLFTRMRRAHAGGPTKLQGRHHRCPGSDAEQRMPSATGHLPLQQVRGRPCWHARLCDRLLP